MNNETPTADLAQSKIPPATPDADGNVTYTVTGTHSEPGLSVDGSGNVTYTAPVDPIVVHGRQIKRGRHPAVTKGAFGGKRKDNGINYRASSLIRRFR